MLTDATGRLAGLFTDSDLARLFESRRDDALDAPIEAVMTRDPYVVDAGAKLSVALDLFKVRKISELPVVDPEGRPVGMLDITDLIGIEPPARAAETAPRLRRADLKTA
jgi:arabinose-5-phosphate isomerase